MRGFMGKDFAHYQIYIHKRAYSYSCVDIVRACSLSFRCVVNSTPGLFLSKMNIIFILQHNCCVGLDFLLMARERACTVCASI